MKSGEHKKWWEKNWDNRLPDIQEWLTTHDEWSRQYLYQFVKDKRLKRILEVGPGVLKDWDNYFSQTKTAYHICDITPQVVELAQSKGIPSKQGDIEELPYKDDEFSLVYCRHVWEHLEYYEKALDEMLRVSRKYVIVIFWLLGQYDKIDFTKDRIYQNTYGVKRLNSVLAERELKYRWVDSSTDKILLIEK